jgi:hypothetical protein
MSGTQQVLIMWLWKRIKIKRNQLLGFDVVGFQGTEKHPHTSLFKNTFFLGILFCPKFYASRFISLA